MLTVTKIGNKLGISPQKVNRLLQDIGYQSKLGGSFQPTELGKPFAKINFNGNDYGGYAHRSWQWLTWSEKIVPKLQDYLQKQNHKK